MILAILKEIVAKHVLYFNFKAFNNEVEYKALLVGMRLAYELGVQHLKAFSNSLLVVGQVHEGFDTKPPPWRSTSNR